MKDRINEIFDVLDLVAVRLILLVLLILGGCTVIRSHAPSLDTNHVKPASKTNGMRA